MIENNKTPEFFYKYLSFDTAKKVLDEGTLQLSKPSTFNDPYDCQLTLSIKNFDTEKAEKALMEKIWQIYNGSEVSGDNELIQMTKSVMANCPNLPIFEFEKRFKTFCGDISEMVVSGYQNTELLIKNAINKTKILCFTTCPDSPLMWGYYNNHQGVVVKFKGNINSESIKKITYQPEIPSFLNNEIEFVDVYFNPRKIIEKWVNTHFTVKSCHWQHEEEWRLIKFARDENEDVECLPFSPEDILEIIFGCKMSEEDRQEIIKRRNEKYPHAVLSEACKKEDVFGYEIKKLNI